MLRQFCQIKLYLIIESMTNARIARELTSLHRRILASKFAEGVFESEIYALAQACNLLKPKEGKEWSTLNRAKCPSCKNLIDAFASHNFCSYCGQALEWHEEKEE